MTSDIPPPHAAHQAASDTSLPLLRPSTAARRVGPGAVVRRWLGRSVGAALATAAAVGLLALAGEWGGARALREAATQAQASAQLNTVALRSSLDKFRSVPFVLAQDPEVRATLTTPDASRILQLDQKLQALSLGVGASAIYLLNTAGTAVAASNWNEPATFVGVDYQFRPYFRRAVDEGQAEYFALGTVSHEPGLYLSRRVSGQAERLLGVIVLKMDFLTLERDWQALDEVLFVTDRNGVVLMGNVAAWRYRATAPLPAEATEAMRAQQQFGDARFDPLPATLPSGRHDAGTIVRVAEPVRAQPAGASLLHTARPVAGSDGWTLHTLSPVQPAVERAAANAQLATLLAVIAFGLAAGLVIYLRGRARLRAQAQASVQAELESQVLQRTADLRRANVELQTLIDERQQAEARLHRMQDELVQANKLALLGQVAAGVAHEINQPAGAIRAYADNTIEFARRGQDAAVMENLRAIASLTDRIGGITGELRAFSRKASASIASTLLNDALEGALLLVGPRIKRQNVRLHQSGVLSDLWVVADRMRLEQVFVNLLQNALDALLEADEPRIDIIVEAPRYGAAGAGEPAPTRFSANTDDALPSAAEVMGAAAVLVHIRDNGPGLAPHLRLFTPFQTTKPEGLGLGLIISRDILTEFGGTLHAADATPHGAIFTVTLAAAPGPEPNDITR